MPYHTMSVEIAITEATRLGMFCRRSAMGRRLVFYTGTEADPGSWLEAGSTMIDADDCIRTHAFKLITNGIDRHDA